MSGQDLTNEQAIDIVAQVFAKTQGNLQDHQLMQTVLKRLRDELLKEKSE